MRVTRDASIVMYWGLGVNGINLVSNWVIIPWGKTVQNLETITSS